MTALLHTGSDRLLEVRTAYIRLVIKSKGSRKPFAVEDTSPVSILKVVGTDVERLCVPAQGIDEEYIDHQGYAIHELTIAPLFFEQNDYIVTVRSVSEETLEFQSNSRSIEECVSRVMDDDPTELNGVINFGNNVGFTDLIVLADGRQVLSIRMEVYPSKISYKDDYRAMLTDINNMVSESVLDFMRKTYQVFVPDHHKNNVPAVFFAVLQTVYDRYIRAMGRIIAVPHHKLMTEYEVMPHYKAGRTDIRSIRWLEKHPENIRTGQGRIMAERVLSARKKITYDTQENRLVRFMLRSTIQRIDDFANRYKSSAQKPDPGVISGAAKMAGEMRRLLSTTFLASVSEYNASESMSLVFGMAPGYRELYKYYLVLQNGISVGGDIFRMSVRETAQLYEYWCFIKLYDILRSRYTLKSPDIIKVDRKGVTVDLVRGKSSRVTFLNARTGERIYLAYNPSEIQTQTVRQKPDNVLELEKRGSKTAYKYVFDAKYRIETEPDGDRYPDTRPGPKVEDINTMHRYRDSIVYATPGSRFTFEKTMFGAYILFPYANEEEYRKHRFYKSIDSVNIGGLPFLPSATTLVSELLDDLVSDSPESAFERASLPVGIETRLKTVEWKKREVLIGLVPDAGHLCIFLENKMYFTRRFDPDRLPIRYVALYEKGRGISRYGEVVGWEKTERRHLPGISAYPDAQYHVFRVLDWKSLSASISVSEYGPNPVAYTNFFLLSHASVYSELMLKSEADYRFFTELRRRTEKIVIGEINEATAFEFDGVKVLFDDTRIFVISANGRNEFCTVEEFAKRPRAKFGELKRMLANDGI